jgi:hypothetical protein
MFAMQVTNNKDRYQKSSLIIVVNGNCERFQVMSALFKEINFQIQNNG